jgi:hypothetical protein
MWRDGHPDGSLGVKLPEIKDCSYGPFTPRVHALSLPSGLGDEAAGLRFDHSNYRFEGDFDPVRARVVSDVVLVRIGHVLAEFVLPGRRRQPLALPQAELDVVRVALDRVRAALPQESRMTSPEPGDGQHL